MRQVIAIIATLAAAMFGTPHARAQTTINYVGTPGCPQAHSFSHDFATQTLSIVCATVACASTPGTFTLSGSGTRTVLSRGAEYKVRILRTGGCGGNYRVRYALGVVKLLSWSFNETQSNGFVDFAPGETYKDLLFIAGPVYGNFLLLLVDATPIAPTTEPTTVVSENTWFDVIF